MGEEAIPGTPWRIAFESTPPIPLQKKHYPFLYANPPKGWTGHIPENWREEITMANEARRQKALELLSSEDVQDALELTGQTIVSEDVEQQLAASDRQHATLQDALDSSLAMQQEDEQTMSEARELLERAARILGHAFGGGDLTEQIRAFLAAHPAPVGGLEADEDE